MYWNRSAAEIAAAWQAEIDNKLEAGATATLTAGAPNTTLASAMTLLGQQQSALLRNDIATPQLIAGGNSAMWLALLFSPQPTGNHLNAPEPSLMYGGADEATYLTVVGLANVGNASAKATTGTMAEESLATQSAMSAYLMPRLQPGVATHWELLPFVEMGEQSPPPTPNAQHTDHHTDHQSDWIAWGSMLLTVFLIVLAILV